MSLVGIFGRVAVRAGRCSDVSQRGRVHGWGARVVGGYTGEGWVGGGYHGGRVLYLARVPVPSLPKPSIA